MRGKCMWYVSSTLNQGTGTQTPNRKTTLHQHRAYCQTAAPSLSAEGVCPQKSQTGILRTKGNTSDYKWNPYVHSLLLKWSESFHMSGIRISAKAAGKKKDNYFDHFYFTVMWTSEFHNKQCLSKMKYTHFLVVHSWFMKYSVLVCIQVLCLHHLRVVSDAHERAEEGTRSEVAGGSEPSCGCWAPTQVLCKSNTHP